MELDATWAIATRVWWAYFWRNIFAIMGGMIIGGIFGGMMGFILAMVGVPPETTVLVVTPIGFVIGILISIVPIKMILNKNFGAFRLVLVENT